MLTIFEKISLRAKHLKLTRKFFDDKGCLEVDVPICNKGASVDAYIDLFEVTDEGFLHSSPELRMKDLLTKQSGDIYFLGHVFRKEEIGARHNSEFTMLEYYFTNTSEKEFLNNTISYLSLFLGDHPVEILTYQEALDRYTPIDYNPPNNFTDDEQRHYLFSHHIENHLGINKYTVIKDFPVEEASLAVIESVNGKKVAKRYELFFDKTELGNGFKELACADTAKQRFSEANATRKSLDKQTYPLDEVFLTNLKQGLPDNTYGIAIGFDRLLMLAEKLSHINQVIL